MSIARRWWGAAGALLALSLAVAEPASAQDPSSASPTGDNRRAAADAFDKGTSRYAAGDFASAADWFELADRLSPDASALESAVRAHHQAETPAHLARAATLALAIRARYPGSAAMARLADDILGKASPTMTRVTVKCDRCQIEIDGVPQSNRDVFLTPGDHRVVGHFPDGRDASRTLEARSGKSETIDLSAPTALVPAPAVAPALVTSPDVVSSFAPSLSRAYAIGGIALTAVLGGAAAVSWFADALPSGRSYVREVESTHARNIAEEDGIHAAETRTDVLLVGTAVVGAATLVVSLLLTGWKDERQVTTASRRLVWRAEF